MIGQRHTSTQVQKVVKLRHPWRIVSAVILALIALMVIVDASTRPAYDWPIVAKYLFDPRIIQAAGFTFLLTIIAMTIGITLGIVLAIMRQSENPVFKGVSWCYLWIFRGTPVYVQLVFWGLITVIYTSIDIGIPFTEPWFSLKTDDLLNAFWIAALGLALNEAAYMAEIVRAGLLSVDPGQSEAAKALGMSWSKLMRRVILPQAMRVIVPPTGNQIISMLKSTSLVTAVPFSLELYSRSRDIAGQLFTPIPLLIVASLWYLAVTSILMIGQHYIEKRFSRGIGDRP